MVLTQRWLVLNLPCRRCSCSRSWGWACGSLCSWACRDNRLLISDLSWLLVRLWWLYTGGLAALCTPRRNTTSKRWRTERWNGCWGCWCSSSFSLCLSFGDLPSNLRNPDTDAWPLWWWISWPSWIALNNFGSIGSSWLRRECPAAVNLSTAASGASDPSDSVEGLSTAKFTTSVGSRLPVPRTVLCALKLGSRHTLSGTWCGSASNWAYWPSPLGTM